jgi:acetyl-CoA carboxylase carboxyltransferase component
MQEEKPPRADLAAVLAAQAAALDAARPETVARMRAKGGLTIRESLGLFLDPGSLVEYGRLARPARPEMTGAADGMVMGTGMVAGRPVAVMGYDYTVYAGTQSLVNHPKATRMFQLAAERMWPVVCWLEGGGARPHDTIATRRPSGSTPTFVAFARLSGLVPTVAIAPGYAFAGQANLAGMADVLIATRRAVIGMAGPPLVEAALGKQFKPEEIGPVEVHVQSGVIDILVEDDAAAAAMAQRYLSYFVGPHVPGAEPDTARLRDLVPENPRRAYDVRRAIQGIADIGSITELKPSFGKAMVTALARIEGRPVGFVANQPMYLAGAIDSPASDKAARFISLCDAFDIPIVILCDTPGLMVGPEVETTGLVRHSARILMNLANATVPFMTVVLRKAYGLGYYVMGSRPLDPTLLVAWPTAEFGGMGIEGAVNIIHKKELDAATDPAARAALHAGRTEELKVSHTALAQAGHFAVDDVIDPAETRGIIARTLRALPASAPRQGRKHIVDSW